MGFLGPCIMIAIKWVRYIDIGCGLTSKSARNIKKNYERWNGRLVMKILWNYRLSFVNYETIYSAEFFWS